MDHDFLKGENRERPFTPPPERSLLRWLGALLSLLALVYAGYRVIERMNYRSPPVPAKQAPKATNNATGPTSAPSLPQASAPSLADPETRTITKCVINGRTSYGDGNCAGCITSHVTTKPNLNLMTAARPQAPSHTETPISHPNTIVTGEPINSAVGVKARCEALEAKIASLDAMGRQPQTLQTYDWIRDERKKARDEQFRIPCK